MKEGSASISQFSVKPVPTHISGDIVAVSIGVKEIVLGGNRAKFAVTLFDKNKKSLGTKYVSMEGDEYQKWGNDDSVAIDFVLGTLGFERMPSEG